MLTATAEAVLPLGNCSNLPLAGRRVNGFPWAVEDSSSSAVLDAHHGAIGCSACRSAASTSPVWPASAALRPSTNT